MGRAFLGQRAGGGATDAQRRTMHILYHVLCGSVALRVLSRRGAKLCVLYSQMSDVEAGGATVFPDLGAAIWPKKVSSGSWGSKVEVQGPDLIPVS